MKLTLLGAKRIFSRKDNSEWMILHVAYQDPSYITGFAVDNVVVDPNLVIGNIIEGSTVIINRKPNGKFILNVELRQDQ